MGKSVITMDLAARVTTGALFPNGDVGYLDHLDHLDHLQINKGNEASNNSYLFEHGQHGQHGQPGEGGHVANGSNPTPERARELLAKPKLAALVERALAEQSDGNLNAVASAVAVAAGDRGDWRPWKGPVAVALSSLEEGGG